ncbi:LytR/AlgR family response regulator transcription factor [Mariniflexile gromovii]|uniref:Response regulator transcription factor n=1 Tax=Mariniflexile gromovii TaxID=362523 RepID=A0ABS4BVK7_9FLAO|nr:LytTR family DNA-binding domain-containing protein [Mariniflexile gromovii]MBP0904613.1 response regulator transcription factor [Mariniflexile gromovii]
MVRCLIIEDDKKTVEIIKTVGNEFSEISFYEVSEDQEGALNTILKTKPEIVFINLESVKINFLEFLFEITQYSETLPNFIALASSKEKAFDSYRYGFSDFILKPLNELSIRKSLLRYQKRHPIKQIETICLKSYKDYQYLNVDEILYLKADNNTTDFYMSDGTKISAYKTLKVFEDLLPKTFLRIHKSYIINRNCISRIHYGKSMCILNNEHKIPFTKTFIENIDLINSALSHNTLITLN